MSNDSSSDRNISNNPKLKRVPKIPEDRYKVLEVLGAGGMGVVLKATHVHLNKPVAIKVLNTTNLLDESSIQRFELEAQAGSQLAHPNLVSVFDYGFTEDGEPFLVMEFIEGKSLWDVVSESGTLKLEQFYPIFKQIAKAVQFIHKNNIIHRDIKTSNIMIQKIDDDIYAKLLDFGIAKVITESGLSAHELTTTGNVFGSPLYMSPENCMGRQLDSRSDIYSFGCVMYECLSGTPPLIGENVMQTIQKQISENPKELAALKSSNPSLRSLGRMVHKCIEKEPGNRYASMVEVIQELSASAEEANLSSQALSILQPSTPSMTRWTKTENKIPAQSSISEERRRAQANLAKESEAAKAEEIKAKRANLISSESLFDTQSDGFDSLESSIVSSTNKLADTPGDDLELYSEIEQAQSKKRPKKSVPTWSSPEIIALACLFFVAGLVFTNPTFKSYFQEFATRQSLEEAEKLFSEGKARWPDAEPLYLKALINAKSHKDEVTMGKINYRLGRINYNQGKILKAKQYYLKSMELLEKSKDENKSVYLESKLGFANCLSRKKEYKETEKVLNEAQDLAEKWEMGPKKVGDILMLSAKNYSTSRKRVKHALSFYDHAIKEYSKLEDNPKNILAYAWIESAELSARMRWWPDANRRIDNAIDLANQVESTTIKNEIEKRANKIKAEFENTNKKSPAVMPPPAMPKSTPQANPSSGPSEAANQQRGLMDRPRRYRPMRDRRFRQQRFRQPPNGGRFNH